MKLIKKSVSVVLALLMIFSSFSLLAAYADSGIYDWSTDTKFLRMERNADGYIVDAEGNVIGDENDNIQDGATPAWVETTKAQKGEKVKARFYVAVENGALAFFQHLIVYPTAALTIDESSFELAGGKRYYMPINSDTGIGGWEISGVGVTNKLKEVVTYSIYGVTEEDLAGLSWTFVCFDQGKKGAIISDGSFWIYELDFIVNEDATELAQCYLLPEGVSDYDNFEVPSVISIHDTAGKSFGTGLQTVDDYDYLINPPTYNDRDEDSTLGYKTTLTFNAGDGSFADGEKTATIESDIDPFKAAEGIVEPERPGYLFTGWTATYTATGEKAAEELVATSDIKVGYDDITYTANYQSSGKTATVVANYTDVTTNKAATASKEFATKIGNTIKIVSAKPEVEEENVTYILYSELPTVEHYEFDEASTPAENLTFTVTDSDAVMNVNYKPVQYTAVFDSANGDLAVYESVAYTKDYYTLITASRIPTCPVGMQFMGWSDGENTIDAGSTFYLTGNVTYTAVYEPVDYSIKYVYTGEVPDGVSAPEQSTAHIGDKIVLEVPEAVDGYTFKGWTAESDREQYASDNYFSYDAATSTVTVGESSVTITGIWEKNSYTYNYYIDDEKNVLFESKTYKFGDTPETVEIPDNEALAEKGFPGWTAIEWDDTEEATVSSNKDFVLTKEQLTYWVEFVNKDGEALTLDNEEDYIEAYYGDEVNSSMVVGSADVEGYTATGKWHIDSADGEIAEFPYTITTDVTFYADYTVNKHYLIYYKDEDATDELKKFEVEYGTLLDGEYIIESVDKEGYEFVGWSESIKGETMPDSDVLMIPSFNILSYNITWVIDGVESTTTQEFGTSIVAPDAPEKAGYTFAGWSTIEDGAALESLGTVPANNNSKFYAVYAGKDDVKYTVESYYMNTSGSYDGVAPVVGNLSGKTGSNVSVTPETLEGFTFDDSQANVLEGTIAGDGSLVLKVYYSRNKVNVTIDDVTEEKYYGEEIAQPETPAVDDGYEFDKWVDENGDEVTFPVIVGTDDIVIKSEVKASNDTVYTVEVYTMGTDGKYGEPEKSTETGTTDTTATYAPEAKTGFTLDNELSVLEGNIAGDGSLVLKAYYSRNKVNVTVNGVTEEKYYGEEIAQPETPAVDDGYEFDKWVDENGDEVTFPVIVGTEDIVIKSEVKASTDTVYTVEVYTMGTDGQYGEPEKSTETGTTDTMATYAPEAKTGFTLDSNSSVLEGNIAGDGSLVLKVYYSRNKHDVKYMINSVVDETISVYYGASVDMTRSPAEENIPTGYEFDFWATNPSATAPETGVIMNDSDMTVYAILSASDDVKYTVKKYFMNTSGSYEGVEAVEETLKGATDSTVEYKPAAVEGFTVDNSQPNVLIGTVAGDGSLVLKVYYSRNKVNVTIDDVTEEKYYGEEIAQPETPDAADGYEFDKWVDENGDEVTFPVTVGTEDITIKPEFKAVKYTVTFIVEGMEEAYAQREAAFDSEIVQPDEPTKTGYTFKGWALSANGEVVEQLGKVPVGGITFYAVFEGNEGINYTVKKFYMNTSGNGWLDPVDSVRTGKAGETVNLNFSSEAAEGFTIDEANSTKSAVISGNGDTILVVYYNRNKVNVTINGVTEEKYYGEEITQPADPTPDDGYKFGKWVDEDGNEVTFPITVGTEDIVIAPEWVKKSFNLTFKNANGEVISGPTSVEFGASITAPEVDDKEGFTFIGWIAEGTGARFNGTMPATDVVYVETWNSGDSVQYKIETYIMNMSGEYELVTWAYGSAVTGSVQYLSAEALEGFTVDDENSVLSASVAGDGSTVLKAYYARNMYKVTFDAANETELYFGQAIPEVEPAAQTGKTFIGWVVAESGEKAPATMPASNLALVSDWEDTVYTITYVANGTQTKAEYKYGEAVTAPDAPEVSGLKFIGWQPVVPTQMPAEDLIIVAKFETAMFKVTFLDYDGGIFEEEYVRSGDAIQLPATAPVKENYVFVEWVGVPDAMPASDIVISSAFERVPVKLIPKAGSTTVVDSENMVVYGLDLYITSDDLYETYLDVEGDGYFTVTPVKSGFYGTGTKVELYDNVTDNLLETYYIVIFGDLNGDARINSVDIGIASEETAMITSWSDPYSEDYSVYRTMAADLKGKKGIISASDMDIIRDASLGSIEINQVTGTVDR